MIRKFKLHSDVKYGRPYYSHYTALNNNIVHINKFWEEEYTKESEIADSVHWSKFMSSLVICNTAQAIYFQNYPNWAQWSQRTKRYYKDLSLVWGVDRKIHPEDHCLASRGLPSDARQWLRGTDFFCLPITPMIDSYSCITFISERRIFNNVFTLITDIRHIVMTLLWRLMTSLHTVTATLRWRTVTFYSTSVYKTCKNSRCLSFPRDG